jgi:hypothetical protein
MHRLCSSLHCSSSPWRRLGSPPPPRQLPEPPPPAPLSPQYTLKPEGIKEFVQLTQKYADLRNALLPFLGQAAPPHSPRLPRSTPPATCA